MNRARLGWYWRRLRAMPLAEIPWRVQRSLAARWLSRCVGSPASPRAAPSPVAGPRPGCLLPGEPSDPNALVATVEEWLEQGAPILARRWPLASDEVPDWSRCPATGVRAPMTTGLRLDYRNAEQVGDIKYQWEPARFQFLVPLAQAWRATGDARYLAVIRRQLSSFLAQAPYPFGVHWASALENALRLINWALVWELCGGEQGPLLADDPALREQWLDSIYWHQHFIHRHYAAYSSANNHLIGEAAGVFLATGLWPCWAESGRWRRRARHLLVRESLAQNYPDGVNAEQAIWYQQFVADFLLLACLQGQRQKDPLPEAVGERLAAMLTCVAALTDAGGHVPMIGDADDGEVTGLWRETDVTPFQSQLATGAILFRSPALARKADGRLDARSRVLTGEAGVATWSTVYPAGAGAPLPRTFPDGGYYLLGSDWDTPDEVRVVMDCGPLGLGPLAAHGHADALSVLLHVAGHPVLVDPGTYAYHTRQRWRNYFRGTSAHNTVRLGERDQSEIGGNFLWTRHARAVCTTCETEGGAAEQRVSGYHDGYRKPLGAMHRREVRYDARRREVTVVDRITGPPGLGVEQFWHCHPGVTVTWPDASTACLTVSGHRVTLHADASLQWQTVRGDADTPAGWYSPSFDVRVPCDTLRGGSRTGSAGLTLTTRMVLE